MEEYPFHNAVALCHTLALSFVKRAQVLVDMTCGIHTVSLGNKRIVSRTYTIEIRVS